MKGKLKRKLFTVLMSLLMVITMMPLSYITGTVETADAASGGYSLTRSPLKNYTFTNTRYMEVYSPDFISGELTRGKNHSIIEGEYTGGSLDRHMSQYELNNTYVYCIEHGRTRKESTKYTPKGEFDSAFANLYKDTGHGVVINQINAIMMFAPVGGSTVKEMMDLGFDKAEKHYSSYSIADFIAATQSLVWEATQLNRTESFKSRTQNGLHYQSSFRGPETDLIAIDHYYKNVKGKPAEDIYNWMVTEVAAYLTREETLKEDNEFNFELKTTNTHVSETQNLKTKGDLKLVDQNNKPVTVASIVKDSKGKNQLVIPDLGALVDWQDKGNSLYIKQAGAAMERAEKKLAADKEKYQRTYWEADMIKDDGTPSHAQSFVSGLMDPQRIKIHVSLTTPPPDEEHHDPKFCEHDKPTYFPNITLSIEKVDANPGWDGDNTTGMGNANLAATYTIERKIGSGDWKELDTIELDQNGTVEYFTDEAPVNEDNWKTLLSENPSEYITECNHPITDEDGNVTGYEHESLPDKPGKVEWIGNGVVQYRVTETRPEGRTIDPDTGVRLYTYDYYAVQTDNCSYKCEGLDWNPIEYTVTLKCGANTATYNGTEDSLDIELDAIKETFVNDVQRGNLLVIKSNEADNPFKDNPLGGAKPSRDSLWTIEAVGSGDGEMVHLVSFTPDVIAGGTNVYTASRGTGAGAISTTDEARQIKVGSNGQFIVKDLPFGTYKVTEVKADNEKLVLESFIVEISEHTGGAADVPSQGQWAGYSKTGMNALGFVSDGTGDYYSTQYTANLRDKIESNKIKLTKTDAETGKRILPDEWETMKKGAARVIIRYMGDPTKTDSENEALYGPNGTLAKGIYKRLLPNTSHINDTPANSDDYVFELKNGEIVIKYELPYGKYEVSEFLVPEGYFVGEYDETGLAGDHDWGLLTNSVLKAIDIKGDYLDKGELGGEHGKVDGTKGFETLVSVYDSTGKKVQFKDESNYSFSDLEAMICNKYTVYVTDQAAHEDGNITTYTTYDRSVVDEFVDPDREEAEYIKTYQSLHVLNQNVKGMLEVSKIGEDLVGFVEDTVAGYTVLTPVFESVKKIKNTVFGIYAEEDVMLNDGSEGAKIYDTETGAEIKIPVAKKTNLSKAATTISAFVGKLMNPKSYAVDNYETGSYSHKSGAELWYLKETDDLSDGEENEKRTIYVSPEQKNPEYQASFDEEDDEYTYHYDLRVETNLKAGGENVTDVELVKITEKKEGYVPVIPETEATGKVGGTTLNPIKQYFPIDNDLEDKPTSQLSEADKVYTFEADGKLAGHEEWGELVGASYPSNGTDVDLSKDIAERYTEEYYDESIHKLTAEDLKPAETITVVDFEGYDSDGDGAYTFEGLDVDEDGSFEEEGDMYPDIAPITHTETVTLKTLDTEVPADLTIEYADAEETVIKSVTLNSPKKVYDDTYPALTQFEKAHPGYYLNERAEGANAVAVKDIEAIGTYNMEENVFFVEGYYKNGEYHEYPELEVKEILDFAGKVMYPTYAEIESKKEAGWTYTEPTDAEKKAGPYYIMMDDQDGKHYILLSDKTTWQECDENGNFQKRKITVYTMTYNQMAGDDRSFTFEYDGIEVYANYDNGTDKAVLRISKPDEIAVPEKTSLSSLETGYVLGQGYEFEAEDGLTDVFRSIPLEAPIFFKGADGIKSSMYYRGGVGFAKIIVPLTAVTMFEAPYPRLDFVTYERNADGIIDYDNPKSVNIDWYSGLSPSHSKEVFTESSGLPKGTKVTVTRHEGLGVGQSAHYEIEVVTNATETTPMKITYPDGYSCDIYTAKAVSGNGVGVLDLHNVYKTTRYSQSRLVATIETDEKGVATSPLLPLGKYIVRELQAGDNLINEGEGKEVELTWENQFTPVVWGNAGTFDNKYYKVELELNKEFEDEVTKAYVLGSGAVFGLYNANDLTAVPGGTGKYDALNAAKGTLLDVITPDEKGNVYVSEKLPEGMYYIKELKTKDGYHLLDTPYYFEVKDGVSSPSTFDDPENGIVDSYAILSKKGKAQIGFSVEAQYPMPTFTFNGKEYKLTESLDEGTLKIKYYKDRTEVTATVTEELPAEFTLPNGKVVKLTVAGEAYTLTKDGTDKIYATELNKTSFASSAETEFDWIFENEDLYEVQEVTFTPTGATAPFMAEVIHKPTGVYDDNNQMTYTHEVKYNEGADTLNQGEKAVFNDGFNTFILSLTADGQFDVYQEGKSVTGNVTDHAKLDVVTKTTQADGTLVKVEKTETGITDNRLTENISATNKREDTKAETITVKVNSEDGKNIAAIKNNVEIGRIEVLKVDTLNHTKKLSGAEFTLYSTKKNAAGELVKDKAIAVKTTDYTGLAAFTDLKYGTYIVSETKAPNNYVALKKDFTVVVDSNRVAAKVTAYNKEAGLIEITKISKEDGKRLQGATFSIYTAEKQADGTFKKVKYVTSVTSDATGIARANVEYDDEAYYIVYESSAPSGYLRDTEEYTVLVNKPAALGKAELTIENEEGQEPGGGGGESVINIGTTAEGPSGEHMINAGTTTITDTVSYTGLIPNTTYVMKGRLMVVEGGSATPLRDKNGMEVSAETTFTATETNGTVQVTFNVDATELKGKTLVVYEELFKKNTEENPNNEKTPIASHEDPTDVGQTVIVPEIHTTAHDSETGDHISNGDKEVTIIDTVLYSNLIPGKTYTVSGKLMDKETGKAVKVNGKEVTAERTFTAEKAEGTVDITFTFDGTALQGHTVVAFEKMSVNGSVIATHEDITDKDQSVDIPKVRTTATSDGKHSVKAEKSVTITDKVEYKNLIEGKTYKVSGTLMDKNTGKALEVNGEKITAEKTFVAGSKDGYVNLTFTFDATKLKGHDLVVFEKLYLVETETTLVGSHEDINDKDQTVEIETDVTLKTTATAGGEKTVEASESITIKDTVSYTGLVKGKKYTLKGELMDKATGSVLRDANGKKVTAEKTFVAPSESGTVDMTFTFSAKEFEDTTTVVFEKLYAAEDLNDDVKKGDLVGRHEDLNDEGQTVTITKAEEEEEEEFTDEGEEHDTVFTDTPDDGDNGTYDRPHIGTMIVNRDTNGRDEDGTGVPKTGDESGLMLYLALAILSLMGLGLGKKKAVK